MILTKTAFVPLTKNNNAGTIVGYASVFGVRDDQNDIVPRGAFAAALANYKKSKRAPAMLWMHDDRRPCGAWVKAAEDHIGLLVRGQINLGTKLGREVYALVKQGAVTGLSIGYRIIKSRYDATRRARILESIELDEISLVTQPANRAARISGVKQHKAFLKYDPSQPRVPAGNSDGGQWTETGASREGPSFATQQLRSPTARQPRTFTNYGDGYEREPGLQGLYPELAIPALRAIRPAISGAIALRRTLEKPLARLTDHGRQRTGERTITQKDIREAMRTAHATGNVKAKIGKYGTIQFVYRGANGITLAIETYGRNAGKIITLFRH
ncbi:MAG: HK97 family phage prohead protease [Bdellovibrionales bacterium]